jgi:hypothetical protein
MQFMFLQPSVTESVVVPIHTVRYTIKQQQHSRLQEQVKMKQYNRL